MFKFALKKQSVQSREMLSNQVCNVNETINISKFPLLYATPERVKVEPAHTNDMGIERVKSTVHIQSNFNEKSPIDMSFASIKPIEYDFDQTYYQKDNNSLPLAYINQVSNSPLCSTAMINSCCSCCNSISTRNEETCTCDKSNEQFHSVNGSFFDFDRQQSNTLDLFYVCFKSFQATTGSQINLNYSDLVKLIYTKGDYFLVQNMMNDKRGYVPKSIVSNLTQAWINEKPITV